MPQISLAMPEVDQNITRPLVLDIVRQVKKVVGIPQAAPVIYNGQTEGRYQPGSTLNPTDSVDIANRQTLEIEVEEELEDEFFTTQSAPRPVELVDFFDPKLGINIRPEYKQSTFRINFSYSTPNRSEAIAWRNKAQSAASKSNVTALHETEYHYFYHEKIWELIHHLYTLRESVAPYGQTWDQYVTSHITSRAVMVASQDNKQLLAIREKQMRIQGEFDFRAEPEKVDKDTDKGWRINFTYTFQAARPEVATVTFPVIVHNQIIEDRYIPVQLPDFEAEARRSGSMTKAQHHFEAMSVLSRIPHVYKEEPEYMPAFDRWVPDTRPPDTFMIASLLTTLDDSNVLLNLKDLGSIQIDGDILEFIEGVEYQWVNKLYCSPVQIALYRDESLQAWDCFEIKPNLDVVIKIPKNLRSRYRIAVFITSDITKVDYRSIKRLVQYPKAACKIFKASGANEGKLNAFIQHIRLDDFKSCVGRGGATRQEVINSIVWQKTVMAMYPEAMRIETLAKEINLPKLTKK